MIFEPSQLTHSLAASLRPVPLLLQGVISSWENQLFGLHALIESVWTELLDSWCYIVRQHSKWAWKSLSRGEHLDSPLALSGHAVCLC